MKVHMTIEVEDICKSYDGKLVLENFNLLIESGKSYIVTGVSGSGKTTFLRILLNLEKPDSGIIRLLGDYKYSYLCAGVVFQENRLCESFSAVKNILMVNKNITEETARHELTQLLPHDILDKAVSELSGGQKRRVAIVRACIIPADILVMDEPFTGLDAENRQNAIAYILTKKGNKPFVVTAHDNFTGLDFCKKVFLRKEK